jgi:TRAP-type uncharacterized transport system substrate-binding protein
MASGLIENRGHTMFPLCSGQDVPTIGTQAALITSGNQPDELAYAAVGAVFKNFAEFQLLRPMLSTLEIKDMVPGEAVMPIHPGALKYFREAGLLH